jgi:hypothetical protein
LWRQYHQLAPPPRLRVHFDAADQLILPRHATIKLVDHDKFSPFLVSKPPKKPKLFVGKLTGGWKATDVEKIFEKEVSLEEPFRPVSLLGVGGFLSSRQIHGGSQFDDVKPVTEHIEDDLKYDFRTNTHSIWGPNGTNWVDAPMTALFALGETCHRVTLA